MNAIPEHAIKEATDLVSACVAEREAEAREILVSRMVRWMVSQALPVANETQKPPKELRFDATGALYALRQSATALDCHDQLTARLAQLSAMLEIIKGQGFETFSCYNDDVQENYLSACAMIGRECEELAGLSAELRDAETKGAVAEPEPT